MARKIMVPWHEVIEALKTVPTVAIDGEPHAEVGAVIEALQANLTTDPLASSTPGRHENRDLHEQQKSALVERFVAQAPVRASDPNWIGEDEEPPGLCVGCGHPPHTGSACTASKVGDDGVTPTGKTCGCDAYVDPVVRLRSQRRVGDGPMNADIAPLPVNTSAYEFNNLRMLRNNRPPGEDPGGG